MSNRVTAVILAAGSGCRMNLNITKQRIFLGNESVLRRTVRIFDECGDIDSIVVVSRKDEIDFAKNQLADFKKVKNILIGGKCRAESAKIGFNYVSEGAEYILIHDVARCLVNNEIISSVIKDAILYGAATASCKITDTVKVIDETNSIKATIDRNSLVAVQTPQVFKRELYKKAIESADLLDPLITDDNMLLERLGVAVHCTDTGKENIKITVKEDLDYVDFLIDREKNNV